MLRRPNLKHDLFGNKFIKNFGSYKACVSSKIFIFKFNFSETFILRASNLSRYKFSIFGTLLKLTYAYPLRKDFSKCTTIF